MSQIYNGNTKRPKPKKNQLEIFRISARELTPFTRIQQRVSSAGENALGVTYL